MAERLDALHGRKLALDASLRDLKHVACPSTRQARVSKNAAARAWALSEKVLRTVLIIYALADYNTAPAIVFLRNSGRARHWPHKADEDLHAMVEDCFMRADVDDLADLANEADPQDPAAMHVALRYVGEWRLVQWGTRLNLERAIAPTTSMIVQRADELGVRLPGEVNLSSFLSRPSRPARDWARLFRKRWNARLGKPKVREVLLATEIQQKALCRGCGPLGLGMGGRG